MRVLVINCGSSSLKFNVMAEVDGGWEAAASGVVEGIGKNGSLRLEAGGQTKSAEAFEVPDIGAAVERAMALLREERLLDGLSAVGHRVVHGGAKFTGPARITGYVLEEIEELRRLAPLHNEPALTAIRAVSSELHDPPAVAVFDTSFYAGLPEHVALYALPRELSEKHGIRRYGFHGLAHRSMIERFCELHADISEPRLVSLQLGNGCSVTASKGGVPVETSMGFTPLEGLVMGTRSGDLDPSIPLFIAEREKLRPAEVEEILNRKSGLLGLSGSSSDMRDLLAAADRGDNPSKLAVEAFCHRAKKYVGGYMAVLGGADAILFGGGIGENSPQIREQILTGLGWAAVDVDAGRNAAPNIREARISVDGSGVEVWVMDVDEAAIIAHDVKDCLGL